MRFSWHRVNSDLNKTTLIKNWKKHIQEYKPTNLPFDMRRKKRLRRRLNLKVIQEPRGRLTDSIWASPVKKQSEVPLLRIIDDCRLCERNWLRALVNSVDSHATINLGINPNERYMANRMSKPMAVDLAVRSLVGETHRRIEQISSTVYNFHWGFFPSNTIVMSDSSREYTPCVPTFSWSFSYLFLILEGKKYKKRDWTLLWNANSFIFTKFFNELISRVKRIRVTSRNLILSKKLNKGTPGYSTDTDYVSNDNMDIHLTQNLVHHFWTFKKKFRSLPRRIRRRIYKLKQGRIWVNRVR